MPPDGLRATLQAIFMVLLMPVLFFFGLGCLCYAPPPSGNDYSDSPEVSLSTREMLVGPGAINRSHVLLANAFEATVGEAQVANQALAGSFILAPPPPAFSSACPQPTTVTCRRTSKTRQIWMSTRFLAWRAAFWRGTSHTRWICAGQASP